MVQFLNALIPRSNIRGKFLINKEQLAVAKTAIEEIKPILVGTPLYEALELCQDVSHAKPWKVRSVLEECVLKYRAELYKPEVKDPFQRLILHQAIMGAGFYDKCCDQATSLVAEPTRFVLNHYNFDVRRDLIITREVHKSVLEELTTTPESDRMLDNILQMERRLFGPYRLAPVGGKNWLVLGVAMEELKTETELRRILALPPFKNHGNVQVNVTSVEKLWNEVRLTCQPESVDEVAPFVTSVPGFEKRIREEDTFFALREMKPLRLLTWREKLTEALLRYWVILLSVWITFWLVDEEVIAILSLVFMRIKSLRDIEEEARRLGIKKTYIPRKYGNSFQYLGF